MMPNRMSSHIHAQFHDKAKRVVQLEALLAEALGHVTEKPWDDPTHLHARISRALGKPVKYPEHLAAVEAQDDSAY